MENKDNKVREEFPSWHPLQKLATGLLKVFQSKKCTRGEKQITGRVEIKIQRTTNLSTMFLSVP